MLAADNGHIGAVEKLVALGADVHKADKVSRRVQSTANLSTRKVRAVCPRLELIHDRMVLQLLLDFWNADNGEILQYM